MSLAAIDFLHPRRASWFGWCLLALGAAALGAALWLDGRWISQRAERDAVIRMREEATQRDRLAAAKPVIPTPNQRRLQRIAPQLRQPWLPVLRLVENMTEAPVFLLGLTIDPATGLVRLDGEAGSFEEAVAYTQVLDDGQVTGPAQLRTHETVNEPGTGRASIRFSIETRWRAP
jgi:hypothetical protein